MFSHDRDADVISYQDVYKNGKVYQKYKIKGFRNTAFFFWDPDVWVPDIEMLYLRDIGRYDEDKWRHYSMHNEWKCGSDQWASMPWAAHCVGENSRDEFEYDVYGANVVMEAQPIGDRDINRLSLE
ncbi:MAG: hypothetical protein B0D85_04750, partial [Candidatus Sedimenticola endophacoides]